MNRAIQVFLLVITFLCFSWTSVAQPETHTDLARVSLRIECGTANQFRLQLANQTRWAVSVPTYKNYFSWVRSGTSKKPKTITLESGASVFVLPEDIPINSILYFLELEREIAGSSRPLLETVFEGTDSYNTSWIGKKSSVFFFVDKNKLENKKNVYVKFNFEWELGNRGVFVGGLNEHRAVLDLDSTTLKALRPCGSEAS